MRITEELRAWAREHQVLVGGLGLEEIADRIDESWERNEADFDLMCDKIEAQATCLVEVGEALGVSADQPDSEFYWELAEAARGCIQLPKDADGETIRIGDEVEYGHNVGAVDMLLLKESDEPRVGTTFGGYFCGKELHHVKPDSWERIIADAQADGVRYHNEGRPSDFDALVERCKRLAGDVE